MLSSGFLSFLPFFIVNSQPIVHGEKANWTMLSHKRVSIKADSVFAPELELIIRRPMERLR